MNIKNRVTKLENKGRGGDVQIRVFILNGDGSAYSTDAAGKRTEYTAAEYERLARECEASGETVINVQYASHALGEGKVS